MNKLYYNTNPDFGWFIKFNNTDGLHFNKLEIFQEVENGQKSTDILIMEYEEDNNRTNG